MINLLASFCFSFFLLNFHGELNLQQTPVHDQQHLHIVTHKSAKTIDSIDKANSIMVAADGGNDISKAFVNKKDSLIWMNANIRLDHRIFGYTKPDEHSKRMFLFSVFTDDVEGNPFGCPFGAYYQSSDAQDLKLKYIAMIGHFAKVNVIRSGTFKGVIYINKKWLRFMNG